MSTSSGIRNEERLSQQALTEAQEYLQAVIDASQDAIIAINGQGHVTLFNKAAQHIFGISSEEIMGHPLKPILPEGFFEEHEVLLRSYFQTGAPSNVMGNTVRLSGRHSSGRIFPIELSLSAGHHGEAKFAVAIIRDITERQNIELQLRQAERLQSIGTLAAGIAHEINTPAQFVSDNLAFLRQHYAAVLELLKESVVLLGQMENFPNCSGTREVLRRLKAVDLDFLGSEIPLAINDALDGIGRITKIVKAMKSFAHPGSTEKKPADLNRNIQDTVTVCRNVWKYVADLECDFDAKLGSYNCLIAEINQVILNLIINAADAISDTLGSPPNGKGVIKVTTKLLENQIEIRVSDTGSGIPKNVQARVFEPFFTTKPSGRGSGQGLAIAHNVIVDKHGGKISFVSEQGKGTVFIIVLPLTPF